MVNEEENKDKKKTSQRGETRDYPVVELRHAVNVAKIVKECGGSATKYNLETGLGKKGGQLGNLIAGAKRYGLIKGYGEVDLTELAKKILNPISDKEKNEAYKEAFFNVSLFKNIFERFKGQFPKDALIRNILIRNYGVKTDGEAVRIVNIIKDGIKLIDFNVEYKEEIQESTLPEKQAPSTSKNNKNLFDLVMVLGHLDALTTYQEDIKINTNKLKSIIELLDKFSLGFSSIHTLVSMTNKEFKSGMINENICLSRTKFFIDALKKDLGIDEEQVKNEEE